MPTPCRPRKTAAFRLMIGEAPNPVVGQLLPRLLRDLNQGYEAGDVAVQNDCVE